MFEMCTNGEKCAHCACRNLQIVRRTMQMRRGVWSGKRETYKQSDSTRCCSFSFKNLPSVFEPQIKNVISCSAGALPLFVCSYVSVHVTCCPGLIGDSVIPWVLMTGRIWLPITVAMIWPWALVRSWGVIGCTCSAGLPPPEWLEGPAELGISGIVPIIYKGGRAETKSAGWF